MMGSRQLSKDGFELTLASNHFGHFLLTQLLLPELLAAEARGEQPRIVALTSNLSYMHDGFDFAEAVRAEDGSPEQEAFLARPYSLFRSYGQSKLANVLFGNELSRRLRTLSSRIPVLLVHPGEVATDVMRDLPYVVVLALRLFRPFVWTLLKTPAQGSLNSVHATTCPSLATSDDTSAIYLDRLAPARANEAGCSAAAARRLWEISENFCGELPA